MSEFAHIQPETRPTAPSRRTVVGGALAALTALATGVEIFRANPAHAAPPPAPSFCAPVDPYQSYVGQTQCIGTPQPGVVDIRDLLRAHYGRADLGINRACNIGGTSEHKEGRALDYPFNVNNGTERAQADDLLAWLLANGHELARRMGIMYMIWNHRIWYAYNNPNTWHAYSGPNPHTDHIHFSFGWPGARRETTWWTGRCAASITTPPGQYAYEWGGQQHAFAHGANSALLHWYWDPASQVNLVEWGRQGMQGLPNGFAYHDQQHVFARSPHNTLNHWWWTPQGGVAYADWGGECFSNPVSYWWRPYNQQHIFAKGANNSLYHWFWDPANPTVQRVEWGRQGFQGNPAGFAWHDQQHVFARSPNNTLAHWWWTPQGGVAYADWGGSCLSDPIAYVWSPYSQQHIFAKGDGGAMYHWFWDPANGQVQRVEWGRQGFQGNPTGFEYHDQQHVFARSPNNTLAHWWWTPQGGVAYADWGGQCYSDPASFVFGPYNQQHIFAKAANGEMFHWYWDPGTMQVSTVSWGGQIA